MGGGGGGGEEEEAKWEMADIFMRSFEMAPPHLSNFLRRRPSRWPIVSAIYYHPLELNCDLRLSVSNCSPRLTLLNYPFQRHNLINRKFNFFSLT